MVRCRGRRCRSSQGCASDRDRRVRPIHLHVAVAAMRAVGGVGPAVTARCFLQPVAADHAAHLTAFPLNGEQPHGTQFAVSGGCTSRELHSSFG
jgi:hypothetical protein